MGIEHTPQGERKPIGRVIWERMIADLNEAAKKDFPRASVHLIVQAYNKAFEENGDVSRFALLSFEGRREGWRVEPDRNRPGFLTLHTGVSQKSVFREEEQKSASRKSWWSGKNMEQHTHTDTPMSLPLSPEHLVQEMRTDMMHVLMNFETLVDCVQMLGRYGPEGSLMAEEAIAVYMQRKKMPFHEPTHEIISKDGRWTAEYSTKNETIRFVKQCS